MEHPRSYNIMRHGHKLELGETRPSLENSHLTSEQQTMWDESIEALGIKDPEITYETLLLIEQLADKIFQELPPNAIVVFNSTKTPRTQMTLDLLSRSITRLSLDSDKNIRTSCLWEPDYTAQKSNSLTNISSSLENDGLLKIMQNINMNSESNSLRAYLEKEGTVSHQDEDALVLEAVNADLSRGKQSLFRQRAEILKKQIQDLQKSTHAIDAPVYFYGVGHHGSLIAWDIAFNGRDSYSNVDEIPKPLSLISINPEP